MEHCKDLIDLTVRDDQEGPNIIYRGPATFRCYASNIKHLYNLIGEPVGPVEQAYNSRTTYSVEETIITTETLTEIAGIAKDGGLQIIAPEGLRDAVSNYYCTQASVLLSKKFPRKKTRARETEN